MVGRKTQFIIVLCLVILLASATSHLAIRRLGIFAAYAVPQPYGAPTNSGSIILDGSSLAYDGVNWNEVAMKMGSPIVSWATAGSSPAEWEIENRRSPNTTCAFVVVSAYDLNEYWLCDFRADIVPIRQTVEDLWRSNADWAFSKRILSQYPVMLVRKFFPTVGRSDGVMTGIRDALQAWFHKKDSERDAEATGFGPAAASTTEKLSDWPAGRLQRRLVQMKERCQGKHAFHGPKNLALRRLLQQALRQGSVFFVVMPVSPTYQKEFLDPGVTRQFEQAITEIEQQFPDAHVIRLDHLEPVDHDTVFKDFVHLNTDGQQIATAGLLQRLDKQVTQR